MKTLRKRTLMIALTVTALSLFAFAGMASAQGGPNTGRGNGGTPVTPLTADEIQALNDVLQDEYHAWAVYESVIADFGSVAPFVQIQQAEVNHAAALERLFERYGLELPENEWADAEFDSFDSVEAACVTGVEAEIANADLYVQALASTDKRDLTNVFTNLQAASLESPTCPPSKPVIPQPYLLAAACRTVSRAVGARVMPGITASPIPLTARIPTTPIRPESRRWPRPARRAPLIASLIHQPERDKRTPSPMDGVLYFGKAQGRCSCISSASGGRSHRERERGSRAGLGLAIVKRLVAAQGGRVGVESEMGRGSGFWVALGMT